MLFLILTDLNYAHRTPPPPPPQVVASVYQGSHPCGPEYG